MPDGGTLVPVGRSGIVQTVEWKPLMAALGVHAPSPARTPTFPEPGGSAAGLGFS
ncbi:hypothetical protein QNN98_12075 [Arthrobacter sp. zg-Y1143]|nr:hypothetical protein [Arthrobacter sp. zg-Y1143]